MTRDPKGKSLDQRPTQSARSSAPAAGISRREALRGVVTIGTGAALSAHSILAAIPRGDSATSKPGRVDVHHHMLPPFYMDLRRADKNAGGMPTWSPERSLGDMDKGGVTTALLSLAVSGVSFDAGEAGRSLARKSNDYGAELVKDHPASFGLLAALPMPDPKGSLAEIEYALDTLHADGIALLSSYGDKWLGDPMYTPVFEELNRRQTAVFVHPNVPNCCASLVPHVPDAYLEFLFDTTRTIESLLVNGTFSKFPNVRFIFSHGGGAMPMLANRIERTFPKDLAAQVPNGVLYELRRQYYDIASASNPTSLTALLSVVPSSQVLFGSDFPFIPSGVAVGEMKQAGLGSEMVSSIERGNATRLFARLKG